MKNLLIIFMLFLGVTFLHGQDYYGFEYFHQYDTLYPGCVDNEPSKIYGIDEPFLTPPEFPGGGRVQMARFVHANVEYPDVKTETGEQLKGKVVVRTVIDRCGVPRLIKIVQPLSEEYDKEAMRIVEGFPIFKPGSLDGDRVKVAITVPVYFTKTYVPKKKKKETPEETDW